MSFLTRTQREELKTLSLELFGVSSAYEKVMNGTKLLTKEVEEEVPGEGEEAPGSRKVEVPVLSPSGAKTVVNFSKSFEETKEVLLGYKVRLDAMKEAQKVAREEEAAKKEQVELEAQVQKELAGSSI